MDTSSTVTAWIQLVLLYVWLGGACYVFYLWSRMTRTLMTSMTSLATTTEQLVGSTEHFASATSRLLDRATDTLHGLAQQFERDINPLLDDDDPSLADDAADSGEKYKVE